ncbi:MAG: hypothetical protein IPH45_17335 [Bacteroidales bacterium]|nr:hypothetical protein [Bacteroidales bacterium]
MKPKVSLPDTQSQRLSFGALSTQHSALSTVRQHSALSTRHYSTTLLRKIPDQVNWLH